MYVLRQRVTIHHINYYIRLNATTQNTAFMIAAITVGRYHNTNITETHSKHAEHFSAHKQSELYINIKTFKKLDI